MYFNIMSIVILMLISITCLCSRHGVRQLRNPWADGPEYVTQCPIRPGGTYTYRFTIIDQEGTLWWHAHSRWLRATVHGALIIYPRLGSPYPFPTPKREYPILLGNHGTVIVFLLFFPLFLTPVNSLNYTKFSLKQVLITGRGLVEQKPHGCPEAGTVHRSTSKRV